MLKEILHVPYLANDPILCIVISLDHSSVIYNTSVHFQPSMLKIEEGEDPSRISGLIPLRVKI